MTEHKAIPIVCVVGPTASGKTGLGIEIAKNFNGEIVSADSMQIYKKMQIATAKPTEEEMQGIPHYLMDFVDTSEKFSVAEYVSKAHKVIYEINAKGKLPIIVGGTGLYIDSLINNISFSDTSVNEEVRKKYQQIYENEGIEKILSLLAGVDKETADILAGQRNVKRIIRALEVYETTGIKPSVHNNIAASTPSIYDEVIIGLKCRDRQKLYDRINKRVDFMLEAGLLDETKAVLKENLSETSIKAIGYKELIPYINAEKSLDECVEKLKMETRRYAKRQLTWFNRNEKINWIFTDECNNKEEIYNKAKNILIQRGFILNG